MNKISNATTTERSLWSWLYYYKVQIKIVSPDLPHSLPFREYPTISVNWGWSKTLVFQTHFQYSFIPRAICSLPSRLWLKLLLLWSTNQLTDEISTFTVAILYSQAIYGLFFTCPCFEENLWLVPSPVCFLAKKSVTQGSRTLFCHLVSIITTLTDDMIDNIIEDTAILMGGYNCQSASNQSDRCEGGRDKVFEEIKKR